MYLVATIYVVWLFVHESYFLNINLRLLDGIVFFPAFSLQLLLYFLFGLPSNVYFFYHRYYFIYECKGRLGRSTRNLNVEISLMVVSFAMLFNGVSQHC